MRRLGSIGRVGVLAPPWVPLPPPAYGGIEAVVALLCERLAARGHDVMLVAAPGSEVEGVDLETPLPDLPDQIGLGGAELRHALAALDALADCDVVLEHAGPVPALLASCHLGAPVLHVTHGPIEGEPLEVYRAMVPKSPALRLIALSRAQWDAAPDLPFAAVCPNGIDLDDVPFSDRPGDYLAFLGRMAPEKGAAEAIAIARAAGLQLRSRPSAASRTSARYFERAVEPHMGPDVVWLGELGAGPRSTPCSPARRRCVFPISWPEPFGMVMIEAMACGTPVLATPCGSVPEVVGDGVTGFVRADPRALVGVVSALDEIDRARLPRPRRRALLRRTLWRTRTSA